MMGLEQIQRMSREQAEVAARNNETPLELHAYDWADGAQPNIPSTGYVDNDELYIVARYFVDNSGWGEPGEQAMTASEFMAAAAELHELAGDIGIYWAVVEAGQFQVHVEAFVKAENIFDATEIEGRCMWAGLDLEPLS